MANAGAWISKTGFGRIGVTRGHHSACRQAKKAKAQRRMNAKFITSHGEAGHAGLQNGDDAQKRHYTVLSSRGRNARRAR